MRRIVLCAALAVIMAATASADLQNVEVGGQIVIRGRAWFDTFNKNVALENRIMGDYPGRAFGMNGLNSVFNFSDHGNTFGFVEQKSAVDVKADFTNDVSAYMELQTRHVWGINFRSDYITGLDNVNGDDVNLLQSYIQTDNTFGIPLRMRIGRQDVKLGKGWLISDTISATVDLSFDGVRATYDADDFTIDAMWMKLFENYTVEEDGDVDFYGIYGTYSALDFMDISAYWLLVRDPRGISDTNLGPVGEWFEDLLGVDDYDTTYLNTIGMRLWGASSGFDYDLELAYQFGDADSVGSTFIPFDYVYGDDDAEFDSWAGDLRVGYTFDCAWTPNVFVNAAYFDGEDNRDVSFMNWLLPPLKGNSSVSFNRLFSGVNYSAILDIVPTAQNMSNFYKVGLGVGVQPTETISAKAMISYLGVVDPFDVPWSIRIGRTAVPYVPNLSFLTNEADDDIGTLFELWLKYAYSEDLSVSLKYEHLFAGDAISDGNYIVANGLWFVRGADDKDADYVQLVFSIDF